MAEKLSRHEISHPPIEAVSMNEQFSEGVQQLFQVLENDPEFQKIWIKETIKVLQQDHPRYTLEWSGDVDPNGWMKMNDGSTIHITHDTYQNEAAGKGNAVRVFADRFPERMAELAPDYLSILYPKRAKYLTPDEVQQKHAEEKRSLEEQSRHWLRHHLAPDERDQYKHILDRLTIHTLRAVKDPYFLRHFNGETGEDGFLLDTHGQPSNITPESLLGRMGEEARRHILYQTMRTFLREHPEVIERNRKAVEMTGVLEKPSRTQALKPERPVHDHREVEDALREQGIALPPKIRWLLRERSVALGDVRYGNGFLQASYKIGPWINGENADGDELLSSEEGRPLAPDMFDQAESKLTQPESKLFLALLRDIAFPVSAEETALPSVPHATPEKQVGTCNSAELHHVAVLHPREFGPQEISVVCDAQHRPMLLEKKRGEKSSLVLQDMLLNGVRIPAGAIVAIRWKHPDQRPSVASLDDIEGVHYLRLAMFSVPPEERERAFNLQDPHQANILPTELLLPATMDQFLQVAQTHLLRHAGNPYRKSE